MADLELEAQNTAELRTELIATPHDRGPDQLKDFVGKNILEVKPGTTLLNSRHSNFGGIYARGVGDGVGVLGEATNNVGVHGRSSNGVGVWGHGGTGKEGVLGDATGPGIAGVRGVNSTGHGVRGEGESGVVGTSSATGFSGVSGVHTGLGYGVVGDGAGPGNAGVLGRNSAGHGVRGEGESGVVGTSSATGFSGVSGVHTGLGYGVVGDGTGPDNAGVLGRNSAGHGVRGEGESGVVGISSATGYSGVSGKHTGQGYGVVGDGAGPGNAGVLGRNSTGHGVRGEGESGVVGLSSATGYSGVSGKHTGQGYGVVGDGAGPDNAGVLGRNSTGHGVRGEGSPGVVGINSAAGAGAGSLHVIAGVLGRSTSGPGVHGAGNYGGQFEGGSAQLRLVPGSSAGQPATGAHTIGEIYMDSAAALWVCVASGNPGTWVSVLTSGL